MTWLQDFYDRRASEQAGTSLLWQVCHTEYGQPISDAQFSAMIANIRDALDLSPDDVLLDLCCGNGVVTAELAPFVRQVVGVDFSARLIENAEMHNLAGNVTYRVGDATQPGSVLQETPNVTKVLMNFALQHFTAAEFRTLLSQIKTFGPDCAVMLFTLVPDHKLRRVFYRMRKPGLATRLCRLVGRDVMDWWRREDITSVCASLGLTAEFLEVGAGRSGHGYRFDVRIS